MHRYRVAALITFALLAFGCEDRTAIQVTVSSVDLRVGTDVDELVVHATSPEGMVMDRSFPLVGDWPHTFTLLPAVEGSDAPVDIRIVAQRAGVFVVQRLLRTRFSSGDERSEVAELPASCVGVMCGETEDCAAGTCCAPGACTPPVDAGCEPTGDVDDDCDGDDDDCDGVPDQGQLCTGAIVISEVATAGTGGANDEFVELHNTTPVPLPLAGVSVTFATAIEPPLTAPTFGALTGELTGGMIPGYGYYLVVSQGYGGLTPGDSAPTRWTEDLPTAAGHVRIATPTRELDRFAWGPMTAGEGISAAVLADDTTGSYERKARAESTAESMGEMGVDEPCGNAEDTDDNDADFVQRLEQQPQNVVSSAEPPCP